MSFRCNKPTATSAILWTFATITSAAKYNSAISYLYNNESIGWFEPHSIKMPKLSSRHCYSNNPQKWMFILGNMWFDLCYRVRIYFNILEWLQWNTVHLWPTKPSAGAELRLKGLVEKAYRLKNLVEKAYLRYSTTIRRFFGL